jgi:large subunit ribosomal protein L28
MAKRCEICGKGPLTGNNVSHAHNITRRRWNINLRRIRAKVNGVQKRIRVCTACIRAGRVTKVA